MQRFVRQGLASCRHREVMKITKRCDYALRALIYLAYEHERKRYQVTNKELAEKLAIPFKVLSTVLVQLRQGKLVRSVRGKQGGYRLAENPNDITLYDVIGLIDGELGNYLHDFTDRSSDQSVNAVQVIKDALAVVQGNTIRALRKQTIHELATAYHRLGQEDSNYSI